MTRNNFNFLSASPLMTLGLGFAIISFLGFGCVGEGANNGNEGSDSLKIDSTAFPSFGYPEEIHFKNVSMLTHGGNNAEAYFSFDDKSLVFQSDFDGWNLHCDQIFVMPVSGWPSNPKTPVADSAKKQFIAPPLLSTGKGRTTCAFFMPGNQSVVYASTHLGGDACPPQPERFVDGKYVWPIYDSYDIFVADLNGNITRRLTQSPGYDAEATLSPDGKKIVFTSIRSGDLELWTMNTDGSEQKQVTKGLGYDGGAFFSPDGTRLIFRASRPKTTEEIKVYKDLLAKGLVQPTQMELFTCKIDGTDLRQITQLGGANWAPYFHPSAQKIIFASNHASERGRVFNLYMINLDGSGLEQITFDKVFDSFPMFSYDGKRLVFSSNRFNGGGHDTNVFMADWVD